MLEFLKVIFLGIVEGITEWLPISSTGHMILVDEFVKLNVTHDFMEMFLVVIQLGAILAVVVLYFPKLWPFCSPKNGWIKKDTWILWFKVIVAALPAAIIGLPFDDLLDKLFYNYQTVAVTLILYGVLFIVVENYNKKRRPRIKSLESLPWVHRSSDRCLPDPCIDSGNFPFRFHHPWRYSSWCITLCGSRIQFLPVHSDHVRGQSSETGKIRFQLYRL